MMLLEMLEGHGIRVRQGVVLEAILDGKVSVADQAGLPQEIPADAAVLALELKSRTETIGPFLDVAPEVYVVGDCKAPRILFNAVHEGFEAALEM